jgi:hypothetical protein
MIEIPRCVGIMYDPHPSGYGNYHCLAELPARRDNVARWECWWATNWHELARRGIPHPGPNNYGPWRQGPWAEMTDDAFIRMWGFAVLGDGRPMLNTSPIAPYSTRWEANSSSGPVRHLSFLCLTDESTVDRWNRLRPDRPVRLAEWSIAAV